MLKKVFGIIATATALAATTKAVDYGWAHQYIADPNNGTTSCTNYEGVAATDNVTASPTESEAKWAITRTVLNSNGIAVSVKNAYSTEAPRPLFGNVWTNRINATYK